MQPEDKIDLCFRVTGQTVAVDHGYALFAALSRILPAFHEARDAGLCLLRGRYIGEGLLDIRPHTTLRLRLPAAQAPPLPGPGRQDPGHGGA